MTTYVITKMHQITQISDCGMDSTEVPPSWPETHNIYKYLFYTSLP
jgi:hypothetical protein